MIETVYTLKEAAKIFKTSHDTLNRLCNSGKIRYFEVGKSRRIRESDLNKFMDDQVNEQD